MRHRTLASCILFALSTTMLAAAQSTAFTYQGELRQAGQPVNSSVDMRCRLYDAPASGTQVGPEVVRSAVSVANGVFSEPIDFGGGAYSTSSGRWLEIDIRSPAGSGNFVTLGPRQPLTPTPFALSTRGMEVDASGNVTIGPAEFASSTSAAGCAFTITNNSAGNAICGYSTPTSGTNFAIYGTTASTAGNGVYGEAIAGTGTATGVTGISYATSGMGVFGRSGAFTGPAYGGFFDTFSSSGTAVYGLANSLSGTTYGGYFAAFSPAGYGLYAYNTASTGTAPGVYGRSDSAVGIGVSGYSPLSTGVVGVSDGSGGIGVYGGANAGASVNYGIYGSTSSFVSGYGVYSNGRFGASGTKSFRIDHPIDPANKYLNHYCAEGPEPLNVYSGAVTTDKDGEAWVELPSYYAEINRDPRYTLTVLDEADFALARVARKIQDNRFLIKTSRPNVEVSWEVKGVRNDRWVQRYGVPVEVEKVGVERGTYQHPELYDQPAEMGLVKQAGVTANR
ncbi:MAG: hypothetical protein U1D55_08580 [Phycisphaerae bacterium]